MFPPIESGSGKAFSLLFVFLSLPCVSLSVSARRNEVNEKLSRILKKAFAFGTTREDLFHHLYFRWNLNTSHIHFALVTFPSTLREKIKQKPTWLPANSHNLLSR